MIKTKLYVEMIHFGFDGIFVFLLIQAPLAVRRTQNILCILHSLMLAEVLPEQRLGSGTNIHTAHLGRVEGHLQQPEMILVGYLSILAKFARLKSG